MKPNQARTVASTCIRPHFANFASDFDFAIGGGISGIESKTTRPGPSGSQVVAFEDVQNQARTTPAGQRQ